MAFVDKHSVRGLNTADPNHEAVEVALDIMDAAGTNLASQGVDTDISTLTGAGSGGSWGSVHGGSHDTQGTRYWAWTNGGSDKSWSKATILMLFRTNSAGQEAAYLFATGPSTAIGGLSVNFFNYADTTADWMGVSFRHTSGPPGLLSLTFELDDMLAVGVDHVLRIELDGTNIQVWLDGILKATQAYNGQAFKVLSGDDLTIAANDGGAGIADIELIDFIVYSTALSESRTDNTGPFGTAMGVVLENDPVLPVRTFPFESCAPFVYGQTGSTITVQMLQERNWATRAEFRVQHEVDDATLTSAPMTSPTATAGSSGSGTPIEIDAGPTLVGGTRNRYYIEYRYATGTGSWITLGEHGRTDVEARGWLPKAKPATVHFELAIISDLHLYQNLGYTRLDNLVASLQAHGPFDAIHLLGDDQFGLQMDMTDANTTYDGLRKTRNALQGVLRESTCLHGYGNHERIADYQNLYAGQSFLLTAQPLFFPNPGNPRAGTDFDFHFRIGSMEVFHIVHYVGTNHADEADKLLDAATDRVMLLAEKDWLTTAISGSTAAYKIVTSHQLIGGINAYGRGFGTDGEIAGLYQADMLWPAIKDNIDLFVIGHDHVAAFDTIDGVRCVEAGSPTHLLAAAGTKKADETAETGYADADYAEFHFGWLKVTATANGLKTEYIQCTADDGVTAADRRIWPPTRRLGSSVELNGGLRIYR